MDPRRTLRSAGLLAALVAPLPLATPTPLHGQQSVVVRAQTDGWLGVSVEEQIGVDRDGPWTGITVLRVVEGGPSERAGLRPGDRVVEVNGRPAVPSLFNRVASGLHPGQSMRLVVERDGSVRRSLVVTAAPHPASPAVFLSRELAAAVDSKLRRLDSLQVTFRRREGTVSGTAAEPRASHPGAAPLRLATGDSARVTVRLDSVARGGLLRPGVHGTEWRAEWSEAAASPLLPYVEGLHWVGGARFTPLNEDLAVYFEVDGGLLVTDVIEGTLLPEAGLRPGDVLTTVDGRRVLTLEPVRETLSERRSRSVVLSLVRHGRPFVIRLAPAGR